MAGEGEALFLIPGLGGSAAFWDEIAPALAQRFKVIVMDHRGAGRSERPEQSYSVELLARDAVDVLDHFQIARAHIVGHSTGGAIAQVLAIDYPDRVNRIVLSGSWAKPDDAIPSAVRDRASPSSKGQGRKPTRRSAQFLGLSTRLDQGSHLDRASRDCECESRS